LWEPHSARRFEEHYLGGDSTLERFKAASPQFAAMRKLAMNFRAILFGADALAGIPSCAAQLIPIEGLLMH
jgi:hypothetical protein